MVFDSPLSRSRQSKSCDDKKQPEEDKSASIAKREAKHRGRPRRSGKVEVKKNEDTRKILQNKKSGLEEQRKIEENTKEETVETEVNSKSILDNKGDLLDTERAIKINDTVQNINLLKLKTRSSSKVKTRGLITANDQKLNYDPEHQLTDLQVECSNKDRTTRGHEGGSVKIGIATRTNNKTRRNNISHKYEVDLLEQEKAKLNSCVSNLMEERDKLELKLQKRQNVVLEPQGQIICPSMKKHQEELGDIIKLHDEEKYKLIQHWCSVECQTAIKAYIDGKVQ
ncbi:uncharacterized protein [Bombus flavifrons]|uniref:uncharacterized protein n=1 Tax=Bombus flavifrons TaxID=103934 RepID=UPI003704B1C4